MDDARLRAVVVAAEAVLSAREDQMLTSEEWDGLRSAVAACREQRQGREESFAIDRAGRLVRSVAPARGTPYQHTCDPDVLTEVSHLAGELDGFTLEALVERTGFPSSQVATALAFLKERGIVTTEAKRNYAASDDAHLDAMTEYHALREEGEAAFDRE